MIEAEGVVRAVTTLTEEMEEKGEGYSSRPLLSIDWCGAGWKVSLGGIYLIGSEDFEGETDEELVAEMKSAAREIVHDLSCFLPAFEGTTDA